MTRADEADKSFPIHYVELAESVIIAQGGSAERLYRQLRLSPADIRQPGASLNLEQFEQLMQLVEQHLVSGVPRSIQILRHMPVTIHGLIGMAAMTADTLGDALDTGIRFMPLLIPYFELYRENIGNKTHVHIQRLHDFGSPFNEALTEIIVGSFGKIAHYVKFPTHAHARPSQNCMEVQVIHGCQENTQAFLEYFGVPVKFSCPGNQFILSRDTLSQPLLTRNRAAHANILNALEPQLRILQGSNHLLQRVRRAIASAISRGQVPDAETIAQGLNISSRTLSRRLSEEGQSLNSLIEAIRMERAESLLLKSTLPLHQIAEQLGYCGLSTFSRAFKRARQQSPRALRQSYKNHG